MPVGAHSFADALAMVAEIYRAAGELMAGRGALAGVADEGGWWPQFASNEAALDTLVEAIERAGFAPGADAALSLDVAASELGRDGRYRLALDGREYDRDALAELWLRWLDRYPIASIEDPFGEDDPMAWAAFTHVAGHRVRTCNAVLVKPNQAGTVTEAHAALAAGCAAGFGTIVSARSGETEDVSVAHLAVGWNAGQLKVGSFARGERMAKWNEAVRIEERLGSRARFAGAAAFGRSAR